MNILVPITLFGWPLLVLAMFAALPVRRAVLIGMLGAWMFLPCAGYALPALPDITKMSVTCVSVFVGLLAVAPSRFARLRFTWADAAMLLWICTPLPSAITAGYGPYEGVSGIMNQSVAWMMPYLIGRLCFSEPDGLHELAMGLFIGGLVYVPMVLIEARMSPQLHAWVYGFHQHSFEQSRRMGGWRPMVFMTHGLAVAIFMSTAALCGVWLWASGRARSFRGVPMWIPSLGLFAVAMACRSTYALILMVLATVTLFVSRYLGTRVILASLIAIAPLYVSARTIGGWDAGPLRAVAAVIDQEREGSLGVRLDSEDALWRWVQQQGGVVFGKTRIADLMNADRGDFGRFIPDGYWLIALGKYGMVGLAALLGVLLLPVAVYLSRHPARVLMRADMAGGTALMAVLIMYAMDNLLNAMVNPIFLLAAGGMAGARARSVRTGRTTSGTLGVSRGAGAPFVPGPATASLSIQPPSGARAR